MAERQPLPVQVSRTLLALHLAVSLARLDTPYLILVTLCAGTLTWTLA